ncbi:sodium:proton antiporter [Pontibacter sp. G13]|uniref:sodium:proton antiporter n=1 Tax=Pontibacter sp. G13 TaxID=3074898 RepID=UPI00288AFAA8|nr:sodium:proton antiporter [Pontibacter sp. G13]WNJ20243.1 sodium:proton antiporter [Pontibacter sp. G13]
MKPSTYGFLCFLIFTVLFSWTPQTAFAQHEPDSQEQTTEEHHSADQHDGEHDDAHAHAGEEHHEQPALWSIIPFITLLILIATGPVFFEHFWHKNYKFIAPLLGMITLIYYLVALPHAHEPVHALAEYISFIALLAPLYIASGGILIQIDREGKPWVNVLLLLIGAAISNIIGTTGASMLLIRPFIRLNRDRLKPYHIIFFIFMVSNVGGSLTPIGDPPLFLGFLKGVPFEWTLVNVLPEWGFALACLALIFFIVDSRNKSDLDQVETVYSNKVVLRGTRNFFWLAIIVAAVFLDPNVFDWVPAIEYHGAKYSFLREIIQLSAGAASYFMADKSALRGNEFTFEPINEVVFLFLGIFFSMMPALQLIGEFAASDAGKEFFTVDSIYWITGSLSGFLDNAPTYLNFLSAALAKFDMSVSNIADVKAFAAGSTDIVTKEYLRAISIAAVFFGAFTYIGNGPNFMVKSIAEERGVQMPSFFGYIIRYSLIVLAPILFLTWLIFI